MVFCEFGEHLCYAQKGWFFIVFYDIYVDLCTQKGVSPSKAAEENGLSRTSVVKWKNGSVPSGATLQKLAQYFGVSLDCFLEESSKKEKTPVLTKKDERDIAKRLDAILGEMEGGGKDGLMFDGEPLDDDTRELLRASLQNQLEMAKRLAKQKYTPKKYRK